MKASRHIRVSTDSEEHWEVMSRMHQWAEAPKPRAWHTVQEKHHWCKVSFWTIGEGISMYYFTSWLEVTPSPIRNRWGWRSWVTNFLYFRVLRELQWPWPELSWLYLRWHCTPPPPSSTVTWHGGTLRFPSSLQRHTCLHDRREGATSAWLSPSARTNPWLTTWWTYWNGCVAVWTARDWRAATATADFPVWGHPPWTTGRSLKLQLSWEAPLLYTHPALRFLKSLTAHTALKTMRHLGTACRMTMAAKFS
jgi:hypothetical protein